MTNPTDPDELKQAWQTQPSRARLTVDAELLLNEIKRNQQYFAAVIFWRDFREIGVGLVMIPLWIYLGIRQSLPWTWYLAVPAFLWIDGYMLADRRRHKRPSDGTSDSLRQHTENSLAEVEHQIWLLRNVFWWYLLPLGLAIFAFFVHVAWRTRSLGAWSAFGFLCVMVGIVALVFAGVYQLNQYAVRAGLEPRRRELETLLASLEDKPPTQADDLL
jgi:hypothetical protein